MEDCIDNIIGLSINECPCLPAKIDNFIVNGEFENDLSGWDTNWNWNNGHASSTVLNDPLDQIIDVEIGKEYTLTFNAVSSGADASPTAMVMHIVGATTGSEHTDLNLNGANTYKFTPQETPMTIRFIHSSNENESQIDNVKVTAQIEDASLSGLFIDDTTMQGIQIKGLLDTRNCLETTALWNLLRTIRHQAIRDFKEGFYAMLSNLKVKRHQRTQYLIGDLKKGTGALTASQYPFAVLTPNKTFRGQEIHLRSVKLRFASSYTDTIPVYVYADGEKIYQKDMNMLNGSGEVNFDVILPVVNKYNDTIDYKIVYDRKSGFPMDYKWNCNCGGSMRPWMNYWNMQSGSVGDLSTLEDATTQTKNSMGLQISASIDCNSLAFLCDLDYSVDHGVPRTIAKTIQFMSWKILGSHLLNTNKVDIWSLCKREELEAKITSYNEEIDWRFRWLVQEYNYSFSDCYQCSDSQQTRLVDIGG